MDLRHVKRTWLFTHTSNGQGLLAVHQMEKASKSTSKGQGYLPTRQKDRVFDLHVKMTGLLAHTSKRQVTYLHVKREALQLQVLGKVGLDPAFLQHVGLPTVRDDEVVPHGALRVVHGIL